MTMTLGDAFNRRKKLAADFQTWTQRLGQAGSERRTFRTMAIEGAISPKRSHSALVEAWAGRRWSHQRTGSSRQSPENSQRQALR